MISYRGPLVTLIPSVLKREHLEQYKNDTTLNWEHMQNQRLLIFMYEDSCSVSVEIISLTNRQQRGRDKRKKFTSMRQTDWPLSDPHVIDRIQMSGRGTCQVNSITKSIPTIALYWTTPLYSCRPDFLSDIFCFLKYNLLIRLACLWWVKSKLPCGLI